MTDTATELYTAAEVESLLAAVRDRTRDAVEARAREAGRADVVAGLKALSALNGSTDAVLEMVRKTFEESKHPRNHGRFSGTRGADQTPDSGAPPRAERNESQAPGHVDQEHPADAKARTLADRIKEVPAALVSRVGTWVQAKYDRLAARYGPTGAKAVLGAMILLSPTPIPGSSLIPVALAEAVLRIRRAVAPAQQKAAGPLSGEHVQALARDLLHELYEAEGEQSPEANDALVKEVADKFFRPDGSPRLRAMTHQMIQAVMRDHNLPLRTAAGVFWRAMELYKGTDHTTPERYWAQVDRMERGVPQPWREPDDSPAVEKARHKYISTHVALTGDVADRLRALADSIPDADLAEDGRETESHVTVRYGLEVDDAGEVAPVLAPFGPVHLRLGRVSIFAGADSGKDYDVLKVDVESPDLHALHDALGALPHTDTHPSYHPHATLAYVKQGLGQQYAERMGSIDAEVTAHSVVFSDRDRNQTVIPLAGGAVTGFELTEYAKSLRELPPEHELLLCAVEYARDCAHDGTDPQAVLDALAELADDPMRLRAVLEGTLEKAIRWDEQKHPRGKNGRFISVDRIHAAKDDPALAKELRKEVRPEDRQKLEDALSGKSDVGHTARSKKRADAKDRRQQKTADRDQARAIRDRLFAQHRAGLDLAPDDLRALVPHLSTMSHGELSTLRTFLAGAGVNFGGETRLAERRARVIDWARAEAEPVEVAKPEASGGEKWRGSLTPDEKRAVERVQGGGWLLNRSLRTGDTDPTTADTATHVDSAIAKSPGLRVDSTLHRGLDFDKPADAIKYLADKPVGAEFTDSGYGSTSTDPDYLNTFWNGNEGNRAVKLEIRAPAGTPGAYLSEGGAKHLEHEKEFLVGRGARYKVVAREPFGRGGTKLTVEYAGHGTGGIPKAKDAEPEAADAEHAPGGISAAAGTPAAPEPVSSRDRLSALAAAAPTPEARDHLEAARDNADGTPKDAAAQLAAVWRQAHDAGRHDTAAHLAAHLGEFGAALHGPAPSTGAPFSNRYYESQTGVGPGDTVRVVRQPVTYRDEHGDEHVVAKGQAARLDGADEKPAPAPQLVETGKDAEGKPVYRNPLPHLAKRPYKYPGVGAIETVQRDESHPVEMVDPAQVTSFQDYVKRDNLDRIEGDVKKPVVLVRHGGKLYLEEGNHRAVKAWLDGKKVPAKIIDVAGAEGDSE